ncbi:hypothetical protein [Sporosarcina sp. A2]|uniref:hypothetical protein n=1 Tax=Sporosarcina sp. A2 TaxID=3393449 RepID=UPI003D799987
MKLFGFIALATMLGTLLLIFAGPLFGGVLAFGLEVGCIFWGLYLLKDIHKAVLASSPKKDKVQRAYDQYVSERSEQLK